MKFVAAIFLSILFSYSSSGQIGAHYWSHQYGSKGLLMNGAVIASPEDETSIYYNPGAMGLDKQLGFAFSFITPSYSEFRINNLIGDGQKLQQRKVNTSPGFFAVRFRPFRDNNIVMGVTTFKRYKSDFSFTDQDTYPPFLENFFSVRSDFDFENKVSEDWIGIGIAYKVSENIGIGLTQYGIIHSQSSRFFLNKEKIEVDDPTKIIQSWRTSFNYNFSLYGGAITKLGFSYKADNFKAGLTYTSPTWGRITSSASYSFDDLRAEFQSINVSTQRENVSLLNFKTAHSFGVGVEFDIRKFGVAFSAELFTGVDQFTYLEVNGSPFLQEIETQPSSTITPLESRFNSTSNFALAVQYFHSPRTTLITGIRTDYNQIDFTTLGDNKSFASLTPNIYHLTVGTLRTGSKNSFAIGMDIGIGQSTNGKQLIDFNNITSENFYTFNGQNNVSSRFRSLTLFFTYDFLFQGIQSE